MSSFKNGNSQNSAASSPKASSIALSPKSPKRQKSAVSLLTDDLRDELGIGRTSSKPGTPNASQHATPRLKATGSVARSRATIGVISPGASPASRHAAPQNSSMKRGTSGGGGPTSSTELVGQRRGSGGSIEPMGAPENVTLGEIMMGVEKHGTDRGIDAARMGLHGEVTPQMQSDAEAGNGHIDGVPEFKSLFGHAVQRPAGLHRQQTSAEGMAEASVGILFYFFKFHEEL